jgi:hypothetical protein
MTSASTNAGPEQADDRSLYVADLGEITGGGPRNPPTTAAACPTTTGTWRATPGSRFGTSGALWPTTPRASSRRSAPCGIPATTTAPCLSTGMVDLSLIVWRDPEVDRFEERKAPIEDPLGRARGRVMRRVWGSHSAPSAGCASTATGWTWAASRTGASARSRGCSSASLPWPRGSAP